jgi:hypothetical protein
VFAPTAAPEIVAAKAAVTTALMPTLGGLVDAAFAPGIATFNDRLAKWGAVQLLADPDPAIAAAGFVVLQRDLPAESTVFHLYPAVDSAIASRSIASTVRGFGALQCAPRTSRGALARGQPARVAHRGLRAAGTGA